MPTVTAETLGLLIERQNEIVARDYKKLVKENQLFLKNERQQKLEQAKQNVSQMADDKRTERSRKQTQWADFKRNREVTMLKYVATVKRIRKIQIWRKHIKVVKYVRWLFSEMRICKAKIWMLIGFHMAMKRRAKLFKMNSCVDRHRHYIR